MKLLGKWLGIPIGVLTATFGAGAWVMAIEAQTKTNAANIAEIKTAQNTTDQRIWEVLLGQLAVQQRLGVTQDDVKRMAEKAEQMKKPAFKAPKQNEPLKNE